MTHFASSIKCDVKLKITHITHVWRAFLSHALKEHRKPERDLVDDEPRKPGGDATWNVKWFFRALFLWFAEHKDTVGDF